MRPKKKKPRSEKTKRRISESLSGSKQGGEFYQVKSGEGEELRKSVKSGDRFKYQALIDWWRNLSD